MEIKATLQKPYTQKERADFIVAQNYNNGYEIRETEEELQAWGYTEEEKQQQERQRINALSLPRNILLVALYNEKQITPEAIKEIISGIPDMLIYFDYSNIFKRGDALINVLCRQFKITSQEMDNIFMNN